MTRFATLTALPLLCLALPGFADTIEAEGVISRVTLYPWGASVVREVSIDAQPGVHDLIVPGLPMDTPTEQLRVEAGEDVRVGAVNLARGRLPVAEVEERPEVIAAREELRRLEAVLRGHDQGIAAVRSRAMAAQEQVAFLKAMAQPAEGVAPDAEALRALVRLVGEEVLAARETVLAVEAEVGDLTRAREADEEALSDAAQALAALINEGADKAVLTMTVGTSGGPQVVEVTTFTASARWSPIYDLRLDQATETLAVERGVLVSQASGEDWRGVELTLSTARPADQSAPSQLWPWRREILPEQPVGAAELRMRATSASPASMAQADVAGLVSEEVAIEPMVVEMQGATVTYRYPRAVDLRDGVEDLRLTLDTLEVAANVSAIAVPSRDQTAFLMAEIENDTGEVLLPGPATLVLDGAMVGLDALDLVADGDQTEIGFGAIDGVRLTRRVPQRTQGDRGVLTSSNAFEEVAVLEVENLTNRAWPIRVIDQVPYSEQEDLEIEWRATPQPSEEDVDGARGILSWDFELGAGETQEIRLEHTIEWPDDQILR